MRPTNASPPDREGITNPIEANLEKVARFEERQHSKRSYSQRVIERSSLAFGSTGFLLGFVGLCAAWTGGNLLWHAAGNAYFDAPPFPMLEVFMTFVGVLITMAVLVRQNRLAQVEESRAHLELQVNLLAEQKTTKIISLLEELRRDLPGVNNRHDEQAQTLQAATDADHLLAEIESRKLGQAAAEPNAPATGRAG